MISFLRITLPACLSATLALLACLAMPAATSDEQVDKYQWLEEVSSPRSMAWVKAENERSAKILENDPHFAPFESAALQVLQSPERLPHPEMTGDTVYNTWQDATHILGILRRTSRSDYLTAQPHWQTVLDFDALAEKEGQKWVSHGHTCLYPGDEECLVSLSIGGEDANTMREFNLKTGQFVPDGPGWLCLTTLETGHCLD